MIEAVEREDLLLLSPVEKGEILPHSLKFCFFKLKGAAILPYRPLEILIKPGFRFRLYIDRDLHPDICLYGEVLDQLINDIREVRLSIDRIKLHYANKPSLLLYRLDSR